MTQPICVPISTKDWVCVCGEFHHWVRGERAHQCKCGRAYRKEKPATDDIQIFHIPFDERTSLCQCGEPHYWCVGEVEYQCECGRTYRKALGFTVGSLLSAAATIREEALK